MITNEKRARREPDPQRVNTLPICLANRRGCDPTGDETISSTPGLVRRVTKVSNVSETDRRYELWCPIEPDGWCPKMDTVEAVREHVRRDHTVIDLVDVLIRHTYIMMRMSAAMQEALGTEYQAERDIDAILPHPTDDTMVMEVEFNEE